MLLNEKEFEDIIQKIKERDIHNLEAAVRYGIQEYLDTVEADYVYNAADWEHTFTNTGDLTEDMELYKVMEVGRLLVLPSNFAACLPVDNDNSEIRYFNTKAEALAAAADTRELRGE